VLRTAEVKLRLPTWLRLGVKIQEPAFWGTNEKTVLMGCFSFCADKEPGIYELMPGQKMKREYL